MKTILLTVVLAMVALFTYAAFQPAEYTFGREIVIRSTPEAIFAYLNDSKKVDSWMPWRVIDPQMVVQFAGPTEGVGARTEWESPGEMGKGSAEVVEVRAPELVRTKLRYERPMQMEQEATISVRSGAEGSTVRWEVHGSNNVIGRVMCLVMGVRKQVEGSFDLGLNRLAQLVETGEPSRGQ